MFVFKGSLVQAFRILVFAELTACRRPVQEPVSLSAFPVTRSDLISTEALARWMKTQRLVHEPSPTVSRDPEQQNRVIRLYWFEAKLDVETIGSDQLA